jgi:hypothetical protein
MRLFNQALLAQQAWRLIQYPDTLCAQLLKAKYYPNGIFIDTVFSGNGSSTWHAIEYGLELLKQGVIWRVEMVQRFGYGGTHGYQVQITTCQNLKEVDVGIGGFQTFSLRMVLGMCKGYMNTSGRKKYPRF